MKAERKGITLIALIITIIVLLVLAGVSISLVLGENGIIGKTFISKEKAKEEDAKEQVWLQVNGSVDETGKLDFDDLNKSLRDNLNGVLFNNKPLSDENKIESLPATVEYKGYQIVIPKDNKE